MRVLKENLFENKLFISLALHNFRKANLLFLAHQKGWPAGLNPTNTFPHLVCTKSSIRYYEVTEMNKMRTQTLENFKFSGKKSHTNACNIDRTNACYSAGIRGVL